MWERVQEATETILNRVTLRPEICLILGSGLGSLAREVEVESEIPYAEIPGFPRSTVLGHAGRLLVGHLEGRAVAVFQGRFHVYEGYSPQEIAFPTRVMCRLGVRQFILTNAAGGVNPRFRPGDIMLIEDHINLSGQSPLVGPNDERFGPRFPDMSQVYSPRLRRLAEETAWAEGIQLRHGVYAWLTGPAYETPAEVRYLQAIGADAVGMSTVPEAMVAIHEGREVLGFSCITNLAGGQGEKLSHDEVIAVATRVGTKMGRLIKSVVRRMSDACL
ncbi:MAG: purine-nucleoside phosphorylase [Bacillota bacterium]